MHTIRNTLFVGKVLLTFESLSSTNQYALDLLVTKNKPSEGTVISAGEQTAGRGQSGSSWHSEAQQNLTFSLILYPDFLPVRQQFLMSQAVALAVSDTLLAYFPRNQVRVKWPNDLYIADKKVGGMLIRNSISGTSIQSSVIGIGLNINQAIFPENIPNPTSFILELSQTFEPFDLLEQTCKNIELRYLQLRRRDYKQIQADYLDRLYRYQEEAMYQDMVRGEVFMGKIIGLEPSGKLTLAHTGGQRSFDLKEIKFL